MVKYFGNCATEIDWNKLIAELDAQEPAYIGPRHRAGDDAPGIDDVAKLWEDAGYKTKDRGGNASWDMFVPGVNFNKDLVLTFANCVGLETYTAAWISRINPGYVAPWHWDVTDDDIVLSQQKCIRYHCHIQPQSTGFGQALIVDDTYLYNQKQGEIYLWPERKAWHGAVNCGLHPFYSFHFWYCYD